MRGKENEIFPSGTGKFNGKYYVLLKIFWRATDISVLTTQGNPSVAIGGGKLAYVEAFPPVAT